MSPKKFEEIYRRHYATMYRLAKTILYDTDESHDVVDEVFTRLLHAGSFLKGVRNIPDDDKMEGFLMTSVRNRCRDIIRHKTIRERVHALYVVETSQEETPTDTDERLKQLADFIDRQFPSLTQRIFRLHFLQGMTYEEVAQEVGVSRVTVYNHLAKATALINKHFKNQQNNE